MIFAGQEVSDLEKRAARLAREGRAPASFAAAADKLPTAPAELEYLLLWYWELRSANPRGWRFEPLSHSEILAYRELHFLPMTSWDVGELRALDTIWQEVQPEPEKPKQ